MEKEPLTHEQQDAELSRVLEKQVAWKIPQLQKIACAIVSAALKNDGEGVWPDDPTVVDVVEQINIDDRNCVGTAWRLLGKVKLLERTQDRRKSTTKASRGTEIARWRLVSYPLARAFLRRNGYSMELGQKELF